MNEDPFALLADYETSQAIVSLGEISRGRILVPSEAARIAETMEKYPNRFAKALVDSDEALTVLHDTLLSPDEYLFGFNYSTGGMTEIE